MAMPSRASEIAGMIRSASVNLPEPYFCSASASPATVPGTPMASAELRDFCGSALPSRVEKRFGVDRCRRGLAIIDGDILAVGAVDHHEAAAADIAGARIGHGQGEGCGDRGVDGIAAPLQNIGADPRRDRLLRHHHAVFGRDGSRMADLRIEPAFGARRAGREGYGRKESRA